MLTPNILGFHASDLGKRGFPSHTGFLIRIIPSISDEVCIPIHYKFALCHVLAGEVTQTRIEGGHEKSYDWSRIGSVVLLLTVMVFFPSDNYSNQT